MNGKALFYSRLKADLQFQRKVIGTVIDWVIAIYLFIPAIIIIFGGIIIFYSTSNLDFFQVILSYDILELNENGNLE